MLIKKLLFIIAFSTVIAPFILAPHYTEFGGRKLKSGKTKVITDRDTGRSRGLTRSRAGVTASGTEPITYNFKASSNDIKVQISTEDYPRVNITSSGDLTNKQLKSLTAEIEEVVRENRSVSEAKLESLIENVIENSTTNIVNGKYR